MVRVSAVACAAFFALGFLQAMTCIGRSVRHNLNHSRLQTDLESKCIYPNMHQQLVEASFQFGIWMLEQFCNCCTAVTSLSHSASCKEAVEALAGLDDTQGNLPLLVCATCDTATVRSCAKQLIGLPACFSNSEGLRLEPSGSCTFIESTSRAPLKCRQMI